MRSRLIALPPLALLAACGAGANDPGPGSVTQSEARELNEAAEMLDANSIALDPADNTEDAR